MPVFVGAALAAALLSAGCRVPTSEVTLVSYKDPYFPEPYRISLPKCVYRVDSGADTQVVGYAQRAGDAEDKPISQYVRVQIYWRPHPGKTHAESTTTNALLHYVIVTDSGAAEYAGTGFAFPKERPDGRLEIEIESAYLELRLLEGNVPDLLGYMRLTGKLIAECDPGAAAQLIHQSHRLRSGASPEEQP